MSKASILLTRRWPASVEKRLQDLFDVSLNVSDKPMSQAQLREAFATHDAVCPSVTDKIAANSFPAGAVKARIIANYGVGFNHIDIEAAHKAGMQVTNTPDVLTDCTADLAMCLMLMVARRAGEGERQLRANQWSGWFPTHLMGTAVTGKTLGIVGMGRIGQAMARKAHHGFGMKILYHNRRPLAAEISRELAADFCGELGELLARADFVALHCPAAPETWHLINRDTLAQMQPHAFLINTARGDVVDEEALVDALEKRLIAGAGLDVYEHEPQVPEALKAMENVVLLPHLGSATEETRIAMGMRVIDNLEAFFRGEEPPDRIV
ncbi:MAG: D-glycerate dehydrogenase [Pseudomonadales bacterium]|nr:D-glycerate dehydrogenase [Pseudomonadales bacterium]